MKFLKIHKNKNKNSKFPQNKTKKKDLQNFPSFLVSTGNPNEAGENADHANIKEEPVDPIELRRLQQLTANSQFLNGNYQFQTNNNNSNGATFTSLTPASVLHHQQHVPGKFYSFFVKSWKILRNFEIFLAVFFDDFLFKEFQVFKFD